MRPCTTWIVKLLLWFVDRVKSTQDTAKGLSFLSSIHWVVVKRRRFPCLGEGQPREQLKYDYLFFLSTFNGPWGPYIDAFADVLQQALDAVWIWSIGYPGARPVTALRRYIVHNQIESDHQYSAYPGASVDDVRSALHLHAELEAFARGPARLDPIQFAQEYRRLFVRVQNDLGSFGPLP
jgi:hypothetical protein